MICLLLDTSFDFLFLRRGILDLPVLTDHTVFLQPFQRLINHFMRLTWLVSQISSPVNVFITPMRPPNTSRIGLSANASRPLRRGKDARTWVRERVRRCSVTVERWTGV